MTRKDHQLIILMMAKQLQAFQVLLDILREQGRMTPEQIEAIEDARRLDFGSALDALARVKDEYWKTAEKIGLAAPSNDEPDQTADHQE